MPLGRSTLRVRARGNGHANRRGNPTQGSHGVYRSATLKPAYIPIPVPTMLSMNDVMNPMLEPAAHPIEPPMVVPISTQSFFNIGKEGRGEFASERWFCPDNVLRRVFVEQGPRSRRRGSLVCRDAGFCNRGER